MIDSGWFNSCAIAVEQGAHGRHARKLGQLLNQGLGLAVGCLPLQQAQDAKEHLLSANLGFAHGYFHRQSVAVLVLGILQPGVVDDPSFAGIVVVPKIAVVLFSMRRTHQDGEVLPEQVFFRIAQLIFDHAAAGTDPPVLVSQDHRQRHVREKCSQLARRQIVRSQETYTVRHNPVALPPLIVRDPFDPIIVISRFSY